MVFARMALDEVPPRRAGQWTGDRARSCLASPLLSAAMLLVACLGRFGEPGLGRVEAAEPAVVFSPSATVVDCYDYAEATLQLARPPEGNPFTDVHVTGRFHRVHGGSQLAVEGFCDADDGRLFRVRFLPVSPGDYSYSVSYRQGTLERTYDGAFHASDAKRRGLLRVDPDYRWHFVWEGTKEHYFWNGTTAFFLMGWDDENVIRHAIDRLHDLKVNRIRALLAGRSDHYWTEPIKPGNGFRLWLNPWVARRPDSINDPGFDYRRFNVSYWQRYERMLRHAREKEMILSIIFDFNDHRVHPAPGSEDERRYYRYAVARLAAFSNVTWDLGDDLDSFRDEAWTHATGTLLKQWDVYGHLATSHPVDNKHQDRTAQWFGMTSFQQWPRPLHGWMLAQRLQQAKTGRIIPQVNEEYGYEDHYPSWAPFKPPAASADANRRAAWEMAMAGTYQTTGETAKRGTGIPPDTGGGWVNGRGDASMTMLRGYACMVDFFTAFEWWKTEPHDELVDGGPFCLAEPGRLYVVYLSHGGKATLRLPPDRYQAVWFNARDGRYTAAAAAQGPLWTSPAAPDDGDWAILLRKG
jgi:hypothetical protein